MNEITLEGIEGFGDCWKLCDQSLVNQVVQGRPATVRRLRSWLTTWVVSSSHMPVLYD